ATSHAARRQPPRTPLARGGCAQVGLAPDGGLLAANVHRVTIAIPCRTRQRAQDPRSHSVGEVRGRVGRKAKPRQRRIPGGEHHRPSRPTGKLRGDARRIVAHRDDVPHAPRALCPVDNLHAFEEVRHRRNLLYWKRMDGHAPSLPAALPARSRPGSLAEYFRSALYLGVIGFGGGLSVLASIRSLTVERRRWLTEKEFTNAVAVAQMLPGGAAANALAYIGLRFGGLRGALLGYTGFVLPGFAAVMALAVLYTRLGTTPQIDTLLGGFNGAVVGIIAAITLKMAKSAVARFWQMGLAAGALLFSVVGDAAPGEVALASIA